MKEMHLGTDPVRPVVPTIEGQVVGTAEKTDLVAFLGDGGERWCRQPRAWGKRQETATIIA